MIPNPEFDRPGFCALCHTSIACWEGNQVTRLLPIAALAEFELNDGSRMRVMMCSTCVANMTPDEIPSLMESVYKGWIYEIDTILKWDKEKKDQYEEKYGKLHIVGRNDIKWEKKFIEKKLGKKKMKGVKE